MGKKLSCVWESSLRICKICLRLIVCLSCFQFSLFSDLGIFPPPPALHSTWLWGPPAVIAHTWPHCVCHPYFPHLEDRERALLRDRLLTQASLCWRRRAEIMMVSRRIFSGGKENSVKGRRRGGRRHLSARSAIHFMCLCVYFWSRFDCISPLPLFFAEWGFFSIFPSPCLIIPSFSLLALSSPHISHTPNGTLIAPPLLPYEKTGICCLIIVNKWHSMKVGWNFTLHKLHVQYVVTLCVLLVGYRRAWLSPSLPLSLSLLISIF